MIFWKKVLECSIVTILVHQNNTTHTHTLTHSLTHSHTYTHSLTYSLTHALTPRLRQEVISQRDLVEVDGQRAVKPTLPVQSVKHTVSRGNHQLATHTEQTLEEYGG